jgi:hypothetical protein
LDKEVKALSLDSKEREERKDKLIEELKMQVKTL